MFIVNKLSSLARPIKIDTRMKMAGIFRVRSTRVLHKAYLYARLRSVSR